MTPYEKWETVHRLVGGDITTSDMENISSYNFNDGQTPPTEEEVEANFNAHKHIQKRKVEYPDLAEQLDYIYHNGITKWKSDMIKPVKDKYPKGQ